MANEKGNDIVVERHLEAAANAAKSFTLAELAKISVSGGSSSTGTVFTGATSSSAGTSGDVPAPAQGDNERFLRGDGVWARPPQASGGSSDYIIGDGVATVEGGFWCGTVDEKKALRLRSGNYVYNFYADDSVVLTDDTSSEPSTASPDLYVLSTTPATVDGGVWYEQSGNSVTLNTRKGSFKYALNPDTVTYVGGNSNLVSWLPFDTSATQDLCGNTWTATGSIELHEDYSNEFGGKKTLYLQSGQVYADNIIPDLNADKWTFDGWCYFYSNNKTNFALGEIDLTNTGKFAGISISRQGMRVSSLDGTENFLTAFTSEIPNIFKHLAVVKNGSTITVYSGGNAIGSHTLTQGIFGGSMIILGNSPSHGNGSKTGYYSNVRFFKDVALWTQNFTPPTEVDYE